jgi:hypothetical protein
VITYLTVGGRTSAVVEAVQKLPKGLVHNVRVAAKKGKRKAAKEDSEGEGEHDFEEEDDEPGKDKVVSFWRLVISSFPPDCSRCWLGYADVAVLQTGETGGERIFVVYDIIQASAVAHFTDQVDASVICSVLHVALKREAREAKLVGKRAPAKCALKSSNVTLETQVWPGGHEAALRGGSGVVEKQREGWRWILDLSLDECGRLMTYFERYITFTSQCIHFCSLPPTTHCSQPALFKPHHRPLNPHNSTQPVSHSRRGRQTRFPRSLSSTSSSLIPLPPLLTLPLANPVSAFSSPASLLTVHASSTPIQLLSVAKVRA